MNEGESIEENSIADLTTDLYETRFKRCNLATNHWKQYLKLIPNYKNLSDDQFKDLLIKGISIDCRQKVEQSLNNYFMLQFIRQRAE